MKSMCHCMQETLHALQVEDRHESDGCGGLGDWTDRNSAFGIWVSSWYTLHSQHWSLRLHLLQALMFMQSDILFNHVLCEP